MKYYVKCPKCGNEFTIVRKNEVKEIVTYHCEKCGVIFVGRGRSKHNKLDSIDLGIYYLLKENPRMHVMRIAENVGLSDPAIHRRLNRLIEHGYIKIKTEINREKVFI